MSNTDLESQLTKTIMAKLEKLDEQDLVDQLARLLLARAISFAPGELIPKQMLKDSYSKADMESNQPIILNIPAGDYEKM